MKESVGGGWLFGIVIVFIFLFSGFLAYSISYTKAFNVKNEVVNYIEHNEGFTTYSGNDIANERDQDKLKNVEAKIYTLINNIGYDVQGLDHAKCPETGNDTNNYYGVCIIKYCPENNATSNTYYKVTTFIRFGISFLDLKVNIPISGETRAIYTDNSNYSCHSYNPI